MAAVVLVQQQAPLSLALLEVGLATAGYHSQVLLQGDDLDVGAVLAGGVPELLVLVLPRLDENSIAQIAEVDQHYPCPLVLWIANHDPEVLDDAINAGVSAYLSGDFRAHHLTLQLALAKARFKSRQRLKHAAADAKNKLRERKLVDRAKGILMDKRKLTEQEAYRVMRRAAMNKGQPMVQVACSVIQVSELLNT